MILLRRDNNQTIREKIEDTNTLALRQLWRALLRANSPVDRSHIDKLSAQLETIQYHHQRWLSLCWNWFLVAIHFPRRSDTPQLERAPQSEVYLRCTRVAFLLNSPPA
jgi:hypothetical protein